MKTHIVIPIGVGSPGTPVQSYLETSVMSILNQTSKDFVLTVAADSNIPERCKEFLEKNNVEVKWFEPHTYFRKGGIWKKIFDTWKEKDTENVAFLHYDDLWDPKKLEIQTNLMKAENLLGTFSEAYMMNGSSVVTSGDMSFPSLNSSTVGHRSMAFSHSVIISRDAIFNSGILEHESMWAANFEDIWTLYVHKVKNVKKAVGAKFFWRNHDLNISNTVREDVQFVKDQRAATDYSLAETLGDMDKIGFQNIVQQVRKLYV